MVSYNILCVAGCMCINSGLQVKNHFCVYVCIRIRRHPGWPSRPHAHILHTTVMFLRTFCVLAPSMRTICVFRVKWYQITWWCSAQNECAIFAIRTMCVECAPIPPIVQCNIYYPHFLRVHHRCTNFVLYNFCTLRSHVHILRVRFRCTFFVQS